MAFRVYICPWVGTGLKTDPFRAKAVDLGYSGAAFFPSKLDGTPASPWVMMAIRADDFTAIDADATCDDLFGGSIPATVQTRDDLLALLRSTTVGQISAARRTAIQAVLDKYGIVRADFTAQTPLWKVMQRVASTLFEKDDYFASGF